MTASDRSVFISRQYPAKNNDKEKSDVPSDAVRRAGIFTSHSAPALLAGVVMWGIGMGARYDVNLLLMASVSAASQLLAIPFYILSSKSNLTKK